MAEDKMVVGMCRLELLIPGGSSLKGKRRVLKGLIDRARHSFNISIAEVGGNEKWQRAQLGISLVGNDRRFVDSSMSKVLDYIGKLSSVTIINEEREILNL